MARFLQTSNGSIEVPSPLHLDERYGHHRVYKGDERKNGRKDPQRSHPDNCHNCVEPIVAGDDY